MEFLVKWILLFFAAISFDSFAALIGKVVSIHDGDTLTLLREKSANQSPTGRD